MRNRNEPGFTLIELLIVVAIIGIIAAVAIPNLLNAIDQGKQKRTMADLRAIGSAVESYSVDTTIYPTAGNINALRTVVLPTYIRVWPATDGWSYPMVYTPAGALGQGYTLRSVGKDGFPEGAPAGGSTGDFDCDIIFVDGQFMQWPAGMQR